MSLNHHRLVTDQNIQSCKVFPKKINFIILSYAHTCACLGACTHEVALEGIRLHGTGITGDLSHQTMEIEW